MKGRLCAIYRCSRKSELYLYLDKERDPEDLPEQLRRELGRLHPVMTLMITPQRRLARARAEQVLAGIEESGYFLQLPPLPAAGEGMRGG